MSKPRVFVGMPHYSSQVHIAAAYGLFVGASTGGACEIVDRQSYGGSALAKSFNMLWAQALALNEAGRCDWFAMLHADIGPEDNWVDNLIGIALANDADVVSVVMPLKSSKGLTSTGIDNPNEPYEPYRRLTMREVHERLPATFSAADLGHPDKALLINTGCFVARLDRDWCRATDSEGNLLSTFSLHDRIKRINGKWNVGMNPEDWRWSRMLHAAGAKVFATTSIQATHFGEVGYSNGHGWGSFANDQETKSWQADGLRFPWE